MPEMTTRTRRPRPFAQELRALLAEEGYRPRLEPSDGPVCALRFKVEGVEHRVACADDDRDFVQLTVGFRLGERATHDELALLRAANELQASTKVVKVWIPPDCSFVEFGIELFLGGRDYTPALLERSLLTLRGSAEEYFKRVTAEQPAARA
jgi:hypothetical protein